MAARAVFGFTALRWRALRAAVLAAVACASRGFAAGELPATSRAMLLAREAAEATAAEDHGVALEKLETAAELRPDIPRIVLALAAAQTIAGKADAAIATLKRAAALGITTRIDQQPEFAALRARVDFKELARQFSTNQNPKGAGDMAFTLGGVTGLIEAIAWREKTGEFYFGDVNGRAVWVRHAKTGALRRLTPEGDELFGVFALALDEANGALWAATAAVPAMRDCAPDQVGAAALVEVDLESGAIRRDFHLSRGPGDDGEKHLLSNLALGPDGSVYATDRASPVLWRLAPGEQAMTVLAESGELMSLNAVAVAAGGAALVVADEANGLVRVDLGDRSVLRLDPPAGSTLVGIRSLTLAPDGTLLAVQNGLRPPRVLRIRLDDTAEAVRSVAVLEAAHLSMAAPALGCLAAGDFVFIGNAGWARFELGDGVPTKPRNVPVFRTKLASAPKK